MNNAGPGKAVSRASIVPASGRPMPLASETPRAEPPASVFYVIFPDNLSTDGPESTHSIYFGHVAEIKMLELPLLLGAGTFLCWILLKSIPELPSESYCRRR